MTTNIKGIIYLVLAVLVISLQNVAIKWIGGDYSALEIVAIRSVVALPAVLVLYRAEGQRGLPSTQHHRLEYVRGVFLFLSYTTYMMGLAALPLAEIEAIRFSAPLMITFLSVVLLGEEVRASRWAAIIIGFLGVLLVVQPGAPDFNIGSVFILISVLLYAFTAILTRKLKPEDSSATMAYYSSLVYLVAAMMLAPLPFVVGEVADPHPSIAFVIRAWSLPTIIDLGIMAGLGVIWAGWMYLVSRAYSLAEASAAAPFEYISLPINILWGFLIWGEIPGLMTLAGAALTLLCGMYVLTREKKGRQA